LAKHADSKLQAPPSFIAKSSTLEKNHLGIKPAILWIQGGYLTNTAKEIFYSQMEET